MLTPKRMRGVRIVTSQERTDVIRGFDRAAVFGKSLRPQRGHERERVE